MPHDSFDSSICSRHGLPLQPWDKPATPEQLCYRNDALKGVTFIGLNARFCSACLATDGGRLRIGDAERQRLRPLVNRIAQARRVGDPPVTVDIGLPHGSVVPGSAPRTLVPRDPTLVAVLPPPGPALSLNDVVLSADVAKQLARAVTITLKAAVLAGWGLKSPRKPILLFIGPSGTGKTLTGTAYARELGRPLRIVGSTQVEGSHVGESQQKLETVFAMAEANGEALFFDEAEWLLGKRCSSPSNSADNGLNALRDTLLKLLESCSVPVIFATNLPEAVDPAFRRRIGATLKFDLPDLDARRRIVEKELPNSAPMAEGVACEAIATWIAERSEGLSGGDLREVVGNALVNALHERGDDGPVCLSDFEDALAELIRARAAVSRKEPTVRVEEVEAGGKSTRRRKR